MAQLVGQITRQSLRSFACGYTAKKLSSGVGKIEFAHVRSIATTLAVSAGKFKFFKQYKTLI